MIPNCFQIFSQMQSIIQHLSDNFFNATFWNVAATVATAVFTFFLMLTTRKQWKATKLAAEAAEKSANTAEKALFALEGPVLFLVDVKERIFPRAAHDRMYPGSAPPPEVDFFLFNTGRSTAVINKIQSELFFSEKTPSFDFTDKANIRRGITVTAANVKTLGLPCKFHRSLSKEELEKIRKGEIGVYLRGEISYQDTLGFENTYGFCTKYLPDLTGDCKFAATGDKNYHVKKKLDEMDTK